MSRGEGCFSVAEEGVVTAAAAAAVAGGQEDDDVSLARAPPLEALLLCGRLGGGWPLRG